MIPSITEVNFPSYATLHQATISLQEMGERTISTQVRIDGDIVPDFSNWELVFKGERFILPIRDPQAAKDNTSRNSIIDLTFYSWVIYQLKRYYFISLSEVSTGVAIPDQYDASVILPIEGFVQLFNNVLNYYFGNSIRMELFGAGTGIYSTNPVAVEINYTHIWDVLQKFYELFDQRWTIEYDSSTSAYVIKVGFAADAVTEHDFEYGYNGGLLRFERQVQDDNINNILLGRGGDKNLPYRYFKLQDPQNEGWQPDPDAIPELTNIYFDRLRDINFRWYIRGWMQNPNRDTSWDSTHTFPTYSILPSSPYYWAYIRGKTDAKFNPVEYVKDDDSIAKYGERWGALDDNDEIYPTIQGVERVPIGRVDEVVAVSEIITDDIESASQEAVRQNDINGTKTITSVLSPQQTKTDVLLSDIFTIPEGYIGNIEWDWLNPRNASGDAVTAVRLNTGVGSIVVIRESDGQSFSPAGVPSGRYRVEITLVATNDDMSSTYRNVTYGLQSLVLKVSEPNSEAWKPTFDIWVKNIWDTTQGITESDQDYSTRIWEKILGDRVGDDAKVVFSTGFMSVSEDYEFTIASYPVPDRTKMINGVPSEWKITLYKSTAEFEATGLFIPNSQTGGKPYAGDKFYFIGIDMPFLYVQWAEESLNATKQNELDKISEINPTWIIRLDKVRVNTIEDEDYGVALIDRLSAGATIQIKDRRFTNGNTITLYIQSITYTWNEPSDGSPYLLPDVEVVLSDKVLATQGSVSQLQGEVDVIRATYAKTDDIETVVRKVASPLFLKKTGETDSSASPTMFESKVSSKSFRRGDIGGSGWGIYEEEIHNASQASAQRDLRAHATRAVSTEVGTKTNSVFEIDKLVVRKEFHVNSLVVNQISYIGGKQIFSAASIECTQVLESNDGYVCYFDQRQGSVANLFQVGDIAMGQTFDEQDAELRYYRAEVVAVGENYITLSYSNKDGSGAPVAGDIIVQYGNLTNASRQYVIIKDVIGGGYERMISGLNSVSANGTEYYFAGRESGSRERWFVGDANGEYAEYKNGQLNIRGRLSVLNSQGAYVPMVSYMDTIDQTLATMQAQIDGQVQSWASGEAPSPQTKPYPQVIEDVVDPATANFPASSWTLNSDKEKHIGDIYMDDSTGQGYRYTKRVKNDVTEYYWTRITDEELAMAIAEIQALQTNVAGLQYLKNALGDGATIVEGGLVLTSLIQLGQNEGGIFKVYSGINGTFDTTLTDPTKSIAAWYGGPMVDHEADQSASEYAKSLFRMDGSGYLAGGNIGWNASGAGHIPGITWNGNNIIISGGVKLESVSGDSVTELIGLVTELSSFFEKVNVGTQQNPIYAVHVKDNMGIVVDGFGSFGGYNPGSSGGGGGIGISEMWQSLMNEAYPAHYDDKIDAAHFPLGSGLAVDANGNIYVNGATGTVRSIALGEGTEPYTPNQSGLVILPSRIASPFALTAGNKTYDGSAAVTLTKSDIGLGNVTNHAQVKRSEMGANNGVATLGSDGKVPSSQLPSYVDDVLEYASTSSFPATGESGKIYVALDTNKTYRWSGSGYVEISASVVIGTTTGTAFDGGSGYSHVTNGDIHVTAAQKSTWNNALSRDGGSMANTNLVSNLNAEYFAGLSLQEATYPTSPRDFQYGTLVTTSIDYSQFEGAAFYMEIAADTYDFGDDGPLLTLVQGYIYDNTIINYSVTNLGHYRLNTLYAMNINGYLCFWWPRLGYWQSFRVGVYKSATYEPLAVGDYRTNCVVSITDSAEPVEPACSKKVELTGELVQNSAFITDNVASATKLQTQRYIWGRPFDGTSDVTGKATIDGGVELSTVRKIWFTNAGDSGPYLEMVRLDTPVEGEEETPVWALRTNVNLIVEGWASVGGANPGGGGGGGGLVERIYRYAALGGTFSDSDNDTFNAYTINSLHLRLSTVENAGYATQTWVLQRGYITGIDSSMITTALGYTPADASDLSYYALISSLGTMAYETATDYATVSSLGSMAYETASDYATVASLGTMAYETAIDYATVSSLGSMAYESASDYLALSGGGSMANTNLVTNLNADLLDGIHASGFWQKALAYDMPYYDLASIPRGVSQSGGFGWEDSSIHENAGGGFVTFYMGASLHSLLMVFPSYNLSSEPVLYTSIDNGAWGNPRTLAFTSSNVASATNAANADLLNGRDYTAFQSSVHTTGRDFEYGTLIATDIDYSQFDGEPFYMEIKGDTYTRNHSCFTQVQGYIYDNTVINYGVTHLGFHPVSGLVCMNIDGYLCFWFPRQGYWESYSVAVYSSYDYRTNRVTDVTDSAEPAGTRKVVLNSNTVSSVFKDGNGNVSIEGNFIAGGNVGIGVQSPSNKLDVAGVIHATTGIYTEGYGVFGGTASSSDVRLKTDIEDIYSDRALAVLMQLKPKTWTWNDNSTLVGKLGAGFVAQDVQRFLPDAVVNGDYLSLNYNMFHAYEVAGLQNHEVRIAELERKIEAYATR